MDDYADELSGDRKGTSIRASSMAVVTTAIPNVVVTLVDRLFSVRLTNLQPVAGFEPPPPLPYLSLCSLGGETCVTKAQFGFYAVPGYRPPASAVGNYDSDVKR